LQNSSFESMIKASDQYFNNTLSRMTCQLP
jgi:hypothetical protein